MPKLHGLICNLVYTIFTLRAFICYNALSYSDFIKIYTNHCTHFPIACMNYTYILLARCTLFAWGVSLTRRINVVIVNLRCMVFSFACPCWYKRGKIYAYVWLQLTVGLMIQRWAPWCLKILYHVSVYCYWMITNYVRFPCANPGACTVRCAKVNVALYLSYNYCKGLICILYVWSSYMLNRLTH